MARRSWTAKAAVLSDTLPRRLTAEMLGTALLLAAIIGSGIMAERLAGGNIALALLCNTLATGAALFVLIAVFGELSGAHFNPCVSLAFALRREMPWRMAAAYIAFQIGGGVLGVVAAHLMFAEPALQFSTHLRQGSSQALSEAVATFGLILTIFGSLRFRPRATPATVALYIVAAYWFTASTSFANPAVTIARSLTDSFAGIAPLSVPLFIAAQLAGALAGTGFSGWLFAPSQPAQPGGRGTCDSPTYRSAGRI
jgi:glycerol uptake facilitator-like aquaporin